MTKVTLWIIFLAFMVYLSLCAWLYLRQRSILYYPTPSVTTDEAQVIWLSNDDQSLKVWYAPGNNDGRAIIYFGGNAEDVSLNISQFIRLFPQHSIYLHNYRGYGGSTGTASEAAFFSDAVALYDHIRPKYSNITVMGRSLGSGVAVYLAAEKEVSRLVLVTPYDNMVNLARGYYPFVPVSLLLEDRFDSLGRVGGLDIPTLLLIAEYDEVIPRKRADSLLLAIKPDMIMAEIITGAGHNNIGSYPQYEKALSTFCNLEPSISSFPADLWQWRP